MIKQIYKYLWLSPIFILIQIYILNQVMFNGYINPYFYVMLIICLPQVRPKWFLLLFSFSLGLFIDLFEGTVGFHSTAIVIMAFIKPTVEKIVIPKNTISNFGPKSLRVINRSFINFLIFCSHKQKSLNLLKHIILPIALFYLAYI